MWHIMTFQSTINHRYTVVVPEDYKGAEKFLLPSAWVTEEEAREKETAGEKEIFP